MLIIKILGYLRSKKRKPKFFINFIQTYAPQIIHICLLNDRNSFTYIILFIDNLIYIHTCVCMYKYKNITFTFFHNFTFHVGVDVLNFFAMTGYAIFGLSSQPSFSGAFLFGCHSNHVDSPQLFPLR